jgi:hypothetical protein
MVWGMSLADLEAVRKSGRGGHGGTVRLGIGRVSLFCPAGHAGEGALLVLPGGAILMTDGGSRFHGLPLAWAGGL